MDNGQTTEGIGMEEIVLASAEDAEQVGNIYDAVNDYFERHENYC